MAKLIKINPDETREVLHDVPGIGVSARIKHPTPAPNDAQEFYALRLLKPNNEGDGAGKETEYYVEFGRDEARAIVRDLARFLGPSQDDARARYEARQRALGLRRGVPC